jgi:DNA gyrase subunit A
MATSQGTVKKTPLSAFSRPRASGIIAVDLRDDDRLTGVSLTDGSREIMLFSSGGKAIRFHEEEVRPMGRDSTGVRGIKLSESQTVIALIVVGEGHVLVASEQGYGKLTPLDDFPAHGRGGQGVIALQTTERNGATIGALQVQLNQELMMISSNGTLVRTPVGDVSIQGRNTQGVRLIRLDEGERLIGVEQVEALSEDLAGEGDEGLGEGELPASDEATAQGDTPN